MAQTPIRRACVVVKETYLELVQAQGDQRQLREIELRKPGVESVLESHKQHCFALDAVVNALSDAGIEIDVVKRSKDYLVERMAPADLIVTVGGDGTVLRASHYILGSTPVVGVNSAPITSFGHYCICDAQGFADTLAAIREGYLKPSPLLRLRAVLNGETLPELVLNEILITHQHPAGTSRYQVTRGALSEQQRSSGMIIATPAGLTGFLRSEGGTILPIDDRRFAFQERAPFLRLDEEHRLQSGLVEQGDVLTIVSQMQGGKLYIDGEHIQYDFSRGAVLTIEACSTPLIAYVDPDCHQPFIDEARRKTSLWREVKKRLVSLF